MPDDLYRLTLFLLHRLVVPHFLFQHSCQRKE